MAVKIRLQRKGRSKRPFYHIVIADARSSRDGRFIEKIGTYNPLTVPASIEIDRDKAYDWLMKGAQPTDTVRSILRFKGVLFRKHLNRGVKKGALTPEVAEAQYTAWIDEKEAKVAARKATVAAEKETFHARVSGTPKPPPPPPPVVVAAPVVEEAVENVAEEVAVEAAVETTPEVVAEAVVEATPEVVAEAVVEAAPEVVAEAAAVVEETPEVVAEAAAEEVAETPAEEAPATEEEA
ncbi:MAG: 30S ribosomal protein S16 [Saprospiraceae bacterium]